MAEAAVRPLTVEEFVDWHPDDDRRYELVDGVPLLMAPAANAHGRILFALAGALSPALRGTGCYGTSAAGLRLPHRDDTFYVADAVVSCAPAVDYWIPEPRIIFEVLSPSTESHDRKTKVPDYRSIASVGEIVLIDSRERYCEVHRRRGDDWPVAIYRDEGDIVELMDGGVRLVLAELYEGIELEA